MAPINNPKKGNGLVHHAAVSVATGLYCGGYLQHKGESTDTCVLNVQQILCRVITNDAIDLKGTIFFMDRGYGGVDGRITLTMIENGGLVHGTAKRDASIPYVYGESKRRVQPTQQKIEEDGAPAMYEATKYVVRSNGAPVRSDAIGFRNGLGRVVLMRTNIPGFGVGKLELVPSLFAPTKQHPKDNAVLVFESNYVVVATTTQGRPEWFWARKFRITGTSAHLLIKQMLRYIANREPEENHHITWFNRILATVGLSEATQYTTNDEETLKGKGTTVNDLHEIINQYNSTLPTASRRVSKSGTKAQLVTRIVAHNMPMIVSDNTNNVPLLIKLLQTWMMKPFKGNDATYTGTHNESNVRKNVAAFVRSQSDYDIQQIHEYGLLYCKNYPLLAFSPDGICHVRRPQGQQDYSTIISLLEIKTKVSAATVQKEYNIMLKYGLFVDINLSDPNNNKLFHEVVPDIGHRIQILHGMGCSGLKSAFYVIAEPRAIIRVVHVYHPQEFYFHIKYQRTMMRILTKENLLWMNNDGEEDMPAIAFNEYPSELKYAVDQHSVQQAFEICRTLDREYTSKGIPIPETHRILPASVALWNKCKGPIDVYSRYSKNVSMVTSKLTNIGSQWIHMIQTAAYNSFQTQLLLSTNSFIHDEDRCQSWGDYIEHRNAYKRKENFTFRTWIMMLVYAMESKIANIRNERTEQTREETTTIDIKNVKRRRSSSYEQRIRRQNRKDHQIERIEGSIKGRQLHCAWCCHGRKMVNGRHYREGFKCSTICVVCDVPLCEFPRNEDDDERSCFELWHDSRARQIPNPCKDGKCQQLALQRENECKQEHAATDAYAHGMAKIRHDSDSDSGNESENFNRHNVTLTKNNLQSKTKMRGMAKNGADTSYNSDSDSANESENMLLSIGIAGRSEHNLKKHPFQDKTNKYSRK